ncbi:MAG: hypothetical protein ACKVT0_04000 [Planctomycetaceae bacterium]
MAVDHSFDAADVRRFATSDDAAVRRDLDEQTVACARQDAGNSFGEFRLVQTGERLNFYDLQRTGFLVGLVIRVRFADAADSHSANCAGSKKSTP